MAYSKIMEKMINKQIYFSNTMTYPKIMENMTSKQIYFLNNTLSVPKR